MEIPNKYHNGKIYQITDIAYTKCYIGSTTEGLSLRMTRHRAGYKHFLNIGKKFISSFDLFNEYGVENCKIELIEYFKCDSLQELRKREGQVIKNTECVNKWVAGRTQKERYEDNKDKILEQQKEYQQANKDKINEQKRERYKEFYETKKDKLNEQRRERYKLKKEADKIENTE